MEYTNILVADEARAIELSTALWSLSVPNLSGHQTNKYCGWITHPTTGGAVIQLPNKALYIHPEADINALDSFLMPLITAEELDQVHYVLNICRNGGSDPDNENYIPGNRVNFLDFLPQSLTNRVKSNQQLEDEGWFSNNEII